MVRLPDQRSADWLPTVSRHCLLLPLICSITEGGWALDAYIYRFGVIPYLAPGRPPGVYIPSLQHTRCTKTTHVQPSPCVHWARPTYCVAGCPKPSQPRRCYELCARCLMQAGPCFLRSSSSSLRRTSPIISPVTFNARLRHRPPYRASSYPHHVTCSWPQTLPPRVVEEALDKS